MRPPLVIADDERLLTSNEVAAMFRVKRQTVTGWVKRGLLNFVPTPGGHQRFRETEVRALLDGGAS